MKDFLKFTFATITGIIASTQKLHYDAGFEWRTG